MDQVNYFKDTFESMPDYGNFVSILFLNLKKDIDLTSEVEFLLKK